MHPFNKRVWTYSLVALIFIVAVIIRINRLNVPLVFVDEIYHPTNVASLIKNGLGDIFSPQYWQLVGHLPLFTAILFLFRLVLGSSDLVFRLAPMIFGLASIIVIYYFGRANSIIAGLIAMLMLTLSIVHIQGSFMILPYSLVSLIILLSVFLFYKGEQTKDPDSIFYSLIIFGAGLLVSLWSVFYALIIALYLGITKFSSIFDVHSAASKLKNYFVSIISLKAFWIVSVIWCLKSFVSISHPVYKGAVQESTISTSSVVAANLGYLKITVLLNIIAFICILLWLSYNPKLTLSAKIRNYLKVSTPVISIVSLLVLVYFGFILTPQKLSTISSLYPVYAATIISLLLIPYYLIVFAINYRQVLFKKHPFACLKEYYNKKIIIMLILVILIGVFSLLMTLRESALQYNLGVFVAGSGGIYWTLENGLIGSADDSLYYVHMILDYTNTGILVLLVGSLLWSLYKRRPLDRLLSIWFLSSLIVLVILHMRSARYTIFFLMPAYIMTGIMLSDWTKLLKKKGTNVQGIAVALICALLIFLLVTQPNLYENINRENMILMDGVFTDYDLLRADIQYSDANMDTKTWLIDYPFAESNTYDQELILANTTYSDYNIIVNHIVSKGVLGSGGGPVAIASGTPGKLVYSTFSIDSLPAFSDISSILDNKYLNPSLNSNSFKEYLVSKSVDKQIMISAYELSQSNKLALKKFKDVFLSLKDDGYTISFSGIDIDRNMNGQVIDYLPERLLMFKREDSIIYTSDGQMINVPTNGFFIEYEPDSDRHYLSYTIEQYRLQEDFNLMKTYHYDQKPIIWVWQRKSTS